MTPRSSPRWWTSTSPAPCGSAPRRAYAPDHIRVNAIAPGWIATPLTQALQDDPVRSGAILGRTPLGRWGQPEDVADPVLFLASHAARFITGVVLPVDGGYLIA